MDHLTPSLLDLLAPFRSCFRVEVFATFQAALTAWLTCLGPRTLSEVFQASSLAGHAHFSRLYSLFASAKWDWDDLAKLLLLRIVTSLAPSGWVWLVIDDTLCHKRGKHVAFGGIFLDPVLSSKSHKVLRYGLNWVVLGVAVRLPFRPDRCFCLPVLWRVFRKKDADGHQKRTELAAEMARLAAEWLPGRSIRLVADSAYINATLLRDRPKNLHVIGPLPMDAALYRPAQAKPKGRRGPQPKKGVRLPNPTGMLADVVSYPAREGEFEVFGGRRALRVQEVAGVLWYTACAEEQLKVVLVRDPSGKWRDTALVCTDPGASAAEVVQGYCRRWSVEGTFFDSKQFLGLHDPRVRKAQSVSRAHPMAWLCYSLCVLWYAGHGERAEGVRRFRPWYRRKRGVSFADMLGALRLTLWRRRLFVEYGGAEGAQPSREMLESLLHTLAAVR